MAGSSTQPVEPEPRRHRLRRFGEADLAVFPVVLGGATFGWTAAPDTTFAILDAYRAAGGNAVDTADSYASGRSEVLIGTWLRERGIRDEIVLSTKVAKGEENSGLSAQSIIRAVEASLRRLQVEHVDVLYFHLDDVSVPLEESLTAADSLLRSGKVRHLAGADYGPERLMEARVTSGQLTLPKFVGVQTNYSLVNRTDFERDLSSVARAQGLAVVPYSALGSGFLTGKYRGKRGERGSAAQSRVDAAARHMTKRGFRILDALDDVAEAFGVAPATIALSWLLTKPLVTAPVVSASSPEQVADIVAAAGVHLTRAQVASLDRASA
ncbi:alcohol dehydrogenase [Amnibacterium flavum]|uniref:Alcohol dehydrogenase n=2 Tax=Amnibacterium flavum TaxID=2173173 RepID=A0A2V1HTK3_9MICO|nr:alcohol dehydrogenase [Amnibacterium flavum]